ncbi:MAG: BMC domain-containing protein [Ignavibacteriaceae bacterium]
MLKTVVGFLETNNLASAIEAADQMLKAANLSDIQKVNVGGSITSIIIRGDAPSVEAALNAGKKSAQHTGSYLCSNLILELHNDLEKFIVERGNDL